MPHVLIKYAHVLICINRARVSGTLVHFIHIAVAKVSLAGGDRVFQGCVTLGKMADA